MGVRSPEPSSILLLRQAWDDNLNDHVVSLTSRLPCSPEAHTYRMWERVYKPNAQEIQMTARAVVQVLAEHNFKCCVFGSTAAAIYGAENRNPRVRSKLYRALVG
jgi:hypothetical protein